MLEPLALENPMGAQKLGKDLFYINLYANLEFLKDYAHRNGEVVPIPENELPEDNAGLVNIVVEMASIYELNKDLKMIFGQEIHPDSPFMRSFTSILEDFDMLTTGKNIPMMLRGEEYKLQLPPFLNDFFVRETVTGTGYKWGPYAIGVNDTGERFKQLYILNTNQEELLYSVAFLTSYHPVTIDSILSILHVEPPQPYETEEARAFGGVLHATIMDVHRENEQEYLSTLQAGFARREKIHEASAPFREAVRDIAKQMVAEMKEEGGPFYEIAEREASVVPPHDVFSLTDEDIDSFFSDE